MSLEQKIPNSWLMIPHTHPLRWIMMFYALPKEMFENLPEYRQMPRNLRSIQNSEKYLSMIASDDFRIAAEYTDFVSAEYSDFLAAHIC